MPTIAIPTLRGTAQQVLYGCTKTVSCLTKVTVFNNAKEQRWAQRAPLYNFALPMNSLLVADMQAWLAKFSNAGVLGRFGTSLTVTVNGVTYSDLTLESDTLPIATKLPLQYDIEVKLRQVRPVNFSSYSPPSVGSTFPNLKFGFGSAGSSCTQYPFTQMSRFRSSESDNPFGQQFNFPWYANGLSGFPTTYLRAWVLEYPLVDDTDLATLETYFLGKRGRLTSFSFVDPIDHVTYSNVRFASDEMTIRFLAPNQNSTSLQLIQTNA